MAAAAETSAGFVPGDEVWLAVRYGKNGQQSKRKKARVVDVLRAAVVIDHIEGEAGPRTVRFNEIELVTPKSAPLVALEREANALDDVQRWLAQGVAIMSKMQQAKSVLDAQISALEDQALRIQLEVEAKTMERDALLHQLKAVEKLVTTK